MDKSVPRVTVWHHFAEHGDAKTMTLGTGPSVPHTYAISSLKPMLWVLIRIASVSKAILMSTHNIVLYEEMSNIIS